MALPTSSSGDLSLPPSPNNAPSAAWWAPPPSPILERSKADGHAREIEHPKEVYYHATSPAIGGLPADMDIGPVHLGVRHGEHGTVFGIISFPDKRKEIVDREEGESATQLLARIAEWVAA